MTVRTRFAPSPTGFLHVGGARTALFCLLEARHRSGQLVLRIEDTDRERSTPEAVQAIIDGMAWLGLQHDEGPYYQTERFERYRQVAQELLTAGKAYLCYCSKDELESMRNDQEARGLKPRYNGYWRDRNDAPPAGVTPVIRFRNPENGTVTVNDAVRGTVNFDNSELDDLVIWRSDDSPTYNFAVVVDDADMRITDVIRGDDHLNNTPRQINIYNALGRTAPNFAHLPMILGQDGAKLSKRHGAVSVMEWRNDGFLPHAMRNYLVRLGWSHGDQEIFSMDELVAMFRIHDVNHSASRFDTEKLKWLNAHYIKTMDPADIIPELEFQFAQLGLDSSKGPALESVIIGLRERAVTLKEMAEKARVYFEPLHAYDDAAVSKHFTAAVRAPLQHIHTLLAELPEWSTTSIHGALEATAAALGLGMGKFAPALRVAMTGTQVSPSIDQTIQMTGRSEALKRIDAALARLPAAP
jgi:glutamyl-tRNA synthetase